MTHIKVLNFADKKNMQTAFCVKAIFLVKECNKKSVCIIVYLDVLLLTLSYTGKQVMPVFMLCSLNLSCYHKNRHNAHHSGHMHHRRDGGKNRKTNNSLAVEGKIERYQLLLAICFHDYQFLMYNLNHFYIKK